MPDFKATHWALLDLQPTFLADGFIFVATTDVLCHLFMRLTLIPPRKHVLPSPRRGIYLIGDVRYCFVVFTDIEQDEPGDTLLHTWHIREWPHCQTRWFYFVGSQSGVYSVSESAIFKYHFGYPPPALILVFEEPWTEFISMPNLLFTEPWSYYGPLAPTMEKVFEEPWDELSVPPPAMSLAFTEPWTYYSAPPPILSLIFTEPWDSWLSFTLIFEEPWDS